MSQYERITTNAAICSIDGQLEQYIHFNIGNIIVIYWSGVMIETVQL